MISFHDQALIDGTIGGYPSRELIRSRGKDWTTEHIDYALSRIQELTEKSHREKAEDLLMELRADILRSQNEAAATARQVATEVALADLRRAIEKGLKPHWTQSPGFWVAVVAAVAAVIAAWPVIKDWLR